MTEVDRVVIEGGPAGQKAAVQAAKAGRFLPGRGVAELGWNGVDAVVARLDAGGGLPGGRARLWD